MNVQITIRIEGREVETVERTISGDAFDREEESHRLGKEVGRQVPCLSREAGQACFIRMPTLLRDVGMARFSLFLIRVACRPDLGTPSQRSSTSP